MNVVGRFFLRAKHWQIFVLACGVYIVGQIVLVGAMLATPPSQESFAKGGLAAGLVMAFSTLSIFLWFWSLGAFFCSIVQPDLKMKSGFFRVALIYPTFYFVFFVATFKTPVQGCSVSFFHCTSSPWSACSICRISSRRASYWQRPANQHHSPTMQVHFFSSGFAPLESGLCNRG
jgi:hypothetical protein